jgi:hypothetical protein
VVGDEVVGEVDHRLPLSSFDFPVFEFVNRHKQIELDAMLLQKRKYSRR